MPTLSPLSIALLVVLAVSLTGAFIAYMRDRARFRGYEGMTEAVLRLARLLRADLFRDGDDLVASGAWENRPTQVRFSHTENTPGLNIRMGAPVSFTMSVMPVRLGPDGGRVLVRTADERFNARYAVRSDHPTHAQMFLSARNVLPTLQKLCLTSNCLLLVGSRQIEFSEMTAPERRMAEGVPACLELLGNLARELSAMPGANAIKVEPLRRSHRVMGRAALAVGIVVSIAALVMNALPGTKRTATEDVPPAATSGVLDTDAARIPNLGRWRVATASDFDPAAATWLRDSGQAPEGRIQGHFCAGSNESSAYLLVSPENARRLVLMCEGEVIYDVKYPFLGILARISHERLPGVDWTTPPAEIAEADGLLLTRSPGDLASGLVLFTRGHRVVSGSPRDYQKIKLE